MIQYRLTIVYLIALCSYQICYAQSDTLINYNTVTKQIYIYPQSTIDSSKISDHTEWSLGTYTGLDLLELEPPDRTL